MSLILVMGVYHGSPRLLTDKAWGELVHRYPSLAETSPLPTDLEMCLNKFLDDIRQRAEPMRTKRKGLARGFSTFGRVLVSQKRLIVLAVLRGLDDDGCLELLKGLPKELPGVGSHFTFVAVNAGGGGKKERPSLHLLNFSFGDRADDSGLIIEVILRVCGLQQGTEIVTAESCDRPKVSVGEAYTLLPETTHGHRSAPESQTPIDTSGVVSRWKLSGLHEVEQEKQRDVPTHDPHQEVHHTDRKATWVQTSRGSNHAVSWHHLGAEDPAQGGAEQREKPGKSHEDPREMSTKKARRGAQRRVQTIEKTHLLRSPAIGAFVKLRRDSSSDPTLRPAVSHRHRRRAEGLLEEITRGIRTGI